MLWLAQALDDRKRAGTIAREAGRIAAAQVERRAAGEPHLLERVRAALEALEREGRGLQR